MPVQGLSKYAVRIRFKDMQCPSCLRAHGRPDEIVGNEGVSPAHALQEAMKMPFVGVEGWDVMHHR